MQAKEDLRVRKTKAALNAAFGGIIEKKAFEDISINELCTIAGVRRATFYKHYSDKYDFVKEYVGYLRLNYEVTTPLCSSIEKTVDYYVNYAKRIVNYLDTHEKIVNNLLKSNLLHIIIGLITEKNFQDTTENLNQSVRRGLELPASVETVSAMLTGGIATVLFQWLISGKKRDVKLITDEISILIRRVLTDTK